jgi:D-alanyl-D-alanine dipeptidase
MQQDAYGDFDDAYLRAEIVRKICAAQGNIKQNNENYTLIVYDAFRPRSVQILMWDIVKNTPQAAYVANPYKGKGSLHNLGVAVDVSIFDLKNNLPLDMGTPYDFLGALAEPQLENTFLKAGKLTLAQINNRHLLKKAMLEAGFSPIPREWWHFDGFPRSVAEKKYDFLQ